MRMEYTFADKEVLAAFQRAPGVMTRHLGRGLDSAALRMVRAAQRQLRENDSIVLSTLVTAIAYERVGVFEREISPNTDYAEYLERGTRPGHFPPAAPLLAWLKARRAAEPERAVHRLKRHIFLQGTRANPFWDPAFEQSEPTMRQVINDAVLRGVREVFA